MNQRTQNDTSLGADLHEAIIEDYRGFVIRASGFGVLFFVALHVGVKLGYTMAYFQQVGYPPSELTGRAQSVSDVLLAIGLVGILIIACTVLLNSLDK